MEKINTKNNTMKKKTILVTGGLGYIGGYISKYLAQKDNAP